MSTIVEQALKAVQERSKERLEICKKCEHYRSNLQQCKICLCFLPLKTIVPGQHCPLDPPKW